MLSVLLPSDDPRTSWVFQLVAKVDVLTWSTKRVERNPDTVPFSDSKLQRVVVVLNWEGNASGARGREPCDYQRSLLFFCHTSWFF